MRTKFIFSYNYFKDKYSKHTIHSINTKFKPDNIYIYIKIK